MKIFLAGATGAIGRALVPKLVAAGHDVSGTSRRREGGRLIEEMGAHPVIVDVLDARKLKKAVKAERPDVIVHQLTDLSGNDFEANGLLRINGTRNLVDAAKAAGVEAMVAQSIAWLYVRGERPAVESDDFDPSLPPFKSVTALEEAVAEMPRGVVLRYGAFYGPGTWYAADGDIAAKVKIGDLSRGPVWTSFVHVEDAADAALAALDWEAGAVNVVDDEPATADDWLPAYAAELGAPEPRAHRHAAAQGRPVSNAKAKSLGWTPVHPTWRDGLL
ncbi:NAD(P)-dependent oxidoreductase [Actinocorallia sp. A-T 12471]|uniref:NAD-dependent epimerase/dehydratase family protein n=1 Tax=Actinocorallia sp. A-T 12471 TaxID=3089813 RepID=UPI0029CE38CB|nr:NAD(P)-dependent oxidoreductase [Actinocorallia sp. A-T 12471]MDX6742489.1 NAD(P)-dependent oxidoreductase [Actinocorallia sp. A-T 12471]